MISQGEIMILCRKKLLINTHERKELPIACKFTTPLVTFNNFESLNFSNSRDIDAIIKICKCMW